MLNEESVATEGNKTSKYRTIELCSIVEDLKIDMFTPSGWPSVIGDALRSLAGKIPTEYIYTLDDNQEDDEDTSDPDGNSSYGTAYKAFGGGKKGKEACHAIAALCEICCIDSLISNFILPLQVSQLMLLVIVPNLRQHVWHLLQRESDFAGMMHAHSPKFFCVVCCETKSYNASQNVLI